MSRRDLLVLAALAVAVAAVGFRLGAGDGPGALAAAVAGCPAALLLALALARRPARPAGPVLRAVRPLDGTTPAELLRLTAALHAAALDRTPEVGPSPAHDAARAVVAAAPAPLPGVSDLDGAVGTGLRGVVSGLRTVDDGEPVVVAHAVLAGPPGWLAAHGVAVPPELAADALVVAWDGTTRGGVAVGPAARSTPWPARAALAVGALATAAGGAWSGPPGAPWAVPAAALLLVALLGCLPQQHPIVATS